MFGIPGRRTVFDRSDPVREIDSIDYDTRVLAGGEAVEKTRKIRDFERSGGQATIA